MEKVKIIKIYDSPEIYTDLCNKIFEAAKEGFTKTFTIYEDNGSMSSEAVIVTQGLELTEDDTTKIHNAYQEGDDDVELENGQKVIIVD